MPEVTIKETRTEEVILKMSVEEAACLETILFNIPEEGPCGILGQDIRAVYEALAKVRRNRIQESPQLWPPDYADLRECYDFVARQVA